MKELSVSTPLAPNLQVRYKAHSSTRICGFTFRNDLAIRYYFFRIVPYSYRTESFKDKKFGFDFAEIIALNIRHVLSYVSTLP